MKYITLLFSLAPFFLFSQPIKKVANADTYKYMFGLSWSALDDDGNAGNIVNFKDWHYEYFPSRLMFDYYFYNGWSAEASVAFSRYKPDHLVNGQLNKTGFFLSTDLNVKYSFYKLLNEGIFDPYIIMGGGASIRNCSDSLVDVVTPTMNIGAGVNIWFNEYLGMQFQSAGKIGLSSDFFGKSDYMQHTIGVVLRTDALGKGSEEGFQKKKHHFDKRTKKIKVPKGGRSKKRKDT